MGKVGEGIYSKGHIRGRPLYQYNNVRAMYGWKIMCPSVNTMMFQHLLNSSAIVLSECMDEHVQNMEELLHTHNCPHGMTVLSSRYDCTVQPQTSVLARSCIRGVHNEINITKPSEASSISSGY